MNHREERMGLIDRFFEQIAEHVSKIPRTHVHETEEGLAVGVDVGRATLRGELGPDLVDGLLWMRMVVMAREGERVRDPSLNELRWLVRAIVGERGAGYAQFDWDPPNLHTLTVWFPLEHDPLAAFRA